MAGPVFGSAGRLYLGLNVPKQTVLLLIQLRYRSSSSRLRETLCTREQLSVLPAGAAQVFPEPSAGAWRCASSLILKSGAPLCCGLATPPHLHQVSSASIHNVLMRVCVCVCVCVSVWSVRVWFWWFCSWSQCRWLLAVSCFLLWCCSSLHACYCCVVMSECCLVLFGTVGLRVLGSSETHAVIFWVCLL